jgi:hypothetical protein
VGRSVSAQDDSLSAREQVIQRVKKLHLRGPLSREELNIFQNQHVQRTAIALPQGLHLAAPHRPDHLGRKLLAGSIDGPVA